MNNPWVIAALVLLAAVLVGGYLWWHGHRSKGMESKPQPRDQGGKSGS